MAFRYRDSDGPSSGSILGLVAGVLAGFAAGVFVAQRMGGVAGIADRVRGLAGKRAGRGEDYDDEYADEGEDELFEEEEEDTFDDELSAQTLEERVLEAFRNDPILSERAIDIGEVGEGIIELTGWVEDDDEREHAVTVARGVPDVNTVVNRIVVGALEERLEQSRRRVQEGDPSLTETRWEGHRVGTGRRRQGTSQEADRHADPKLVLEDRWMREDQELRNAAEETEVAAERRRAAKKAERRDRAGGAPVAPTGVPKADHVADPTTPEARRIQAEETGRAGGE